jgi:hypothetical protein
LSQRNFHYEYCPPESGIYRCRVGNGVEREGEKGEKGEKGKKEKKGKRGKGEKGEKEKNKL